MTDTKPKKPRASKKKPVKKPKAKKEKKTTQSGQVNQKGKQNQNVIINVGGSKSTASGGGGGSSSSKGGGSSGGGGQPTQPKLNTTQLLANALAKQASAVQQQERIKEFNKPPPKFTTEPSARNPPVRVKDEQRVLPEPAEDPGGDEMEDVGGRLGDVIGQTDVFQEAQKIGTAIKPIASAVGGAVASGLYYGANAGLNAGKMVMTLLNKGQPDEHIMDRVNRTVAKTPVFKNPPPRSNPLMREPEPTPMGERYKPRFILDENAIRNLGSPVKSEPSAPEPEPEEEEDDDNDFQSLEPPEDEEEEETPDFGQEEEETQSPVTSMPAEWEEPFNDIEPGAYPVEEEEEPIAQDTKPVEEDDDQDKYFDDEPRGVGRPGKIRDPADELMKNRNFLRKINTMDDLTTHINSNYQAFKMTTNLWRAVHNKLTGKRAMGGASKEDIMSQLKYSPPEKGPHGGSGPRK